MAHICFSDKKKSTKNVLKSELEISSFLACAVKNTLYCPYLWRNRRNSRAYMRNRGSGTRWWRQILDRKWTNGRFAHAQYKIRYITLIYGRIAKISASNRKSGSRNTLVTSDFRPEMEIWPFRACAVKIRNTALIYGRGISNITFLIFAVLVVRHSYCRPYKSF